MSSDTMEREQMKTYNDLPETYVIFICPFDPFGEGRHIYSFTNRCAEDPELELKDGTHTIFLNAYGTIDDVSPKLKAFLDFVRGIASDDPFIRKLEARVREAKQSPELRWEFMTLSMWEQEKFEQGRAAGFSDGRAAGFSDGRAEGFSRGCARTLDAATAFMKENGMPMELISKFKNSISGDM